MHYNKDSTVKPELQRLRREEISNLATINRLERENKSLRLQVSAQEDEIKYLKINKKASQKPKPSFGRDGLTQPNIDGLWDKAQHAYSDRIQP